MPPFASLFAAVTANRRRRDPGPAYTQYGALGVETNGANEDEHGGHGPLASMAMRAADLDQVTVDDRTAGVAGEGEPGEADSDVSEGGGWRGRRRPRMEDASGVGHLFSHSNRRASKGKDRFEPLSTIPASTSISPTRVVPTASYPRPRSRRSSGKSSAGPERRSASSSSRRSVLTSTSSTDASSSSDDSLLSIPYPRLIRMHLLALPLPFLVLVGLALLAIFGWPPLPAPEEDKTPTGRPRYPYPIYGRDLLVGMAAWLVSFTLRGPVYEVVAWTSSMLPRLCGSRRTSPTAEGVPAAYVSGGSWTTLASVALHTVVLEALRMSAIALLGIRPNTYRRPDPDGHASTALNVHTQAFRRAMWFGVGWATAETLVSVIQTFQQLALYRDVLPTSGALTASRLRLQDDMDMADPDAAVALEVACGDRRSAADKPLGMGGEWTEEDAGVETDGYGAEADVDEEVGHDVRWKRAVQASSRSPLRRGRHFAERAEENGMAGECTSLLSWSSPSVSPARSRLRRQQRLAPLASAPPPRGLHSFRRLSSPSLLDLRASLDERMKALLAMRARHDLEEVYGTPLPSVPAFVVALWRVDAALVGFGLTLLMTATYAHARSVLSPVLSTVTSLSVVDPSSTYLRSSLLSSPLLLLPRSSIYPSSLYSPSSAPVSLSALASASTHPPGGAPPPPLGRLLALIAPAWSALTLFHIILTAVWALGLPRLGIPTVSYGTLLVALGLVVGGLAAWGGVV